MSSLVFIMLLLMHALFVTVPPFGVLCDERQEAKRTVIKNLSEKLFSGYRKDFLPRLNESVAVKVNFDFELITVKEVNAREQTVEVYGWVRQIWHNPFLQWNSSEYGGIETLQKSAEEIWVPDILLYNNVDPLDHIGGGTTTYKTNVVIKANGENDWNSPAIFKALCAIDVTYFPFDMQTCLLKFGSWAARNHQLSMCSHNVTAQSDQYVNNGEWDILEVNSKKQVKQYNLGKFDDVTVTIVIGRAYFVSCVNLIIPCFLISTMIFLGFILPPECGERIGLSITVLLAMTVFQQLTSNIFPSFDFPLLGQYYFAISVEIGLSLLATTMILNFSARAKTKMPWWVRTLLLEWTARIVLLGKTVERSCPKPNDKENIRRRKSTREFKDHRDARHNEVVTHEQVITDESTSDTLHRKDDHLGTELKSMFVFKSDNLDYGPWQYANSVKKLNGLRNGNDSFTLKSPENNKAWGKGGESFTDVLDENGEELQENELHLRQWEWIMAARVLDRALLWVAIITGIDIFRYFYESTSFAGVIIRFVNKN